ncbi:MAG: peptidoglycan DD-metalloendopeptidase family protein [Clostridiales bacterium]|nr:peptidoglycan DD-metalloendopeptidase family protein [Clostridiales bacterium]
MKKKHLIRWVSLFSALVLTVMAPGSLTGLEASAASVSDLQQRVKELEKEQQQLKNRVNQYSSDLSNQKEKRNLLNQQIENMRAQINLLMQQADNLNAQISSMNDDIAAKEQELAGKQEEIDASFQQLRSRLRTIFKSGNMSGLQMLIDTDEFADYLIKSKMMERISANDQALMDGLEGDMERIQQEKEQIQNDKAAVEEQKKQVDQLRVQSDSKKAEMDNLYSQVNAVVKNLEQEITLTKEEMEKKAKEREKLNNEINQLINSTASTGKYGGGTMFWPVPTVRNISSGFGPRWGTIHRGIDIANGAVKIYGQNVVAAADGVVIYANSTNTWGGGYGYYVIVDHGVDSKGQKISTLYAHNSQVLVSVGQKVVGGQTVLSRAGDTGDVTGPHCHFEVRVNGTAVDPIKNGYVKMN